MGRYLKAFILPLFILVAYAALTPTPSASAGTTIPQLRSQLSSARHSLSAARQRLATARSDYQIVLDAFQAQSSADATGVPTDGTTATPDGTATGDGTTTDGTTTDGTSTDPLAGLSPAVHDTVLADGTISQEEVDQLQKDVAAKQAAVRRWQRRTHDLRRRLRIRLWNRSGEWKPLIGIASARYHVSADGLYRLMQLESGGDRYAGATFKGLYQYYPGTWRSSWNPWRGCSIYDGWAQIRATAVAIHRGMGPGHWPNTYWRAF